jgi:hypothetical protein
MDVDGDLCLPEEVDPARWPFCEARARALTACASFPEPVVSVESAWANRQRLALAYRAGVTLDSHATQRRDWEARRRAVRMAS